MPKGMNHHGDVTISLSRLTAFLAAKAEAAGVELYHGYSARTLLVEGGRVVGVSLGEVGLSAHGGEKSNHRPAEEIRARVTILADGTRGVLSEQLRQRFGGGRNPQVYSLGIKAVVAFPGDNPFGTNRVMHTLGYPNPGSVFGGGFMYSMGEKLVAVGLICGLDWKYGNLNPQREFERYRAHPFIADLLKGSVTIATGARTIPEGGYHALGKLAVPGALVVGDGAGFVNMEKIKGIHYGILSGMAAAETIVEGLAASDGEAVLLSGYTQRLEERGILPAMRHARNYRQSFRWGTYVGAPLSMVSSHIPRRLGMEPDYQGTKRGARLNREDPGGMDGATFVSLTGSLHREDEPAAHDDPRPGGVRRLRGRLRELVHQLLPRPGVPVGRLEDRAQRVELPPLHDLRGEVPAPEHPLAAARGRRGPPLQADVIRAPSRGTAARARRPSPDSRSAGRTRGCSPRPSARDDAQASSTGRRKEPARSAAPRATSSAGARLTAASPGMTASARAIVPKTTSSTPR